MLVGRLGVQWDCSEKFNWGLTLGGVGFGYRHWVPFALSHVGFLYPAPSLSASTPQFRAAQPRQPRGWHLRGQLRYAFLADSAFRNLQTLKTPSVFDNPALQQWSLLTDSDLSLEINSPCGSDTTAMRACGLKLWQTLPPLWRTVGALRQTRHVELHGVALLVHFEAGAFQSSVGLGRANAAVDRISASFFYPTLALTYAFQKPMSSHNGMMSK